MMNSRDIERAKAAKAAYMREWARKNRNKRREASLRYWLKKANEAEREKGGSQNGHVIN